MDERHTKRLQENRVVIVTDLEPRGEVLDTLFEDGVLTENDLEQISAGRTRKDRCHLLLAMLQTRGPSAYGSFQRALHSGCYGHLANILGPVPEVSEEERNGNLISENCCRDCPIFLNGLKCENDSDNKVRPDGLMSPFCEILERHPCLILHNIEPTDLIDQLLQDDIMTQIDSERIRSRATRRGRCEEMASILYLSQKNGLIQSFKTSLKKKYNFINEIIFGDDVRCHDNNNHVVDIQLLQKRRALEDEFENESQSITNIKEIASSEESDTDPKVLDMSDEDRHSAGLKGFETLRLSGDGDVSFESGETRTLINEETMVKQFETDDDDEDDLATLKPEDGVMTLNLVHDVRETNNATVRGECGSSLNENKSRAFDDVDGVVVYNRVEIGHQRTSLSKQKPAENKTKQHTRKNRNKKTLTKSSGIELKETNTKKPCQIADMNLEQTERSSQYASTDKSSSGEKTAVVPKSMSNFTTEGPSRRLSVAFNYLSTMINQGDFVKFENVSTQLKIRFPKNYDLMCILGYLHASRDLFRTDFDSAKASINSTMDLALKSTNPRYFILELYTAKTRMYITQKKLEKLQSALDEALMILETDPVGCAGRAAGWLYNNDARNVTTQLTCLNLSKPNALNTYNRLFERARKSFQRSMTNFKKDGGKDGPFGFGFALCRLVILLLRCGDNGKTMDLLIPPEEDVISAGQYLDHLENSDIPIPKILEMHLRLAKCDYHFRQKKLVRALEHAETAYTLASELKMLEFTEHAYNRLSFLKSKEPMTSRVDEITDEEANRILFGDSSESDTQSEH